MVKNKKAYGSKKLVPQLKQQDPADWDTFFDQINDDTIAQAEKELEFELQTAYKDKTDKAKSYKDVFLNEGFVKMLFQLYTNAWYTNTQLDKMPQPTEIGPTDTFDKILETVFSQKDPEYSSDKIIDYTVLDKDHADIKGVIIDYNVKLYMLRDYLQTIDIFKVPETDSNNTNSDRKSKKKRKQTQFNKDALAALYREFATLDSYMPELLTLVLIVWCLPNEADNRSLPDQWLANRPKLDTLLACYEWEQSTVAQTIAQQSSKHITNFIQHIKHSSLCLPIHLIDLFWIGICNETGIKIAFSGQTENPNYFFIEQVYDKKMNKQGFHVQLTFFFPLIAKCGYGTTYDQKNKTISFNGYAYQAMFSPQAQKINNCDPAYHRQMIIMSQQL